MDGKTFFFFQKYISKVVLIVSFKNYRYTNTIKIYYRFKFLSNFFIIFLFFYISPRNQGYCFRDKYICLNRNVFRYSSYKYTINNLFARIFVFFFLFKNHVKMVMLYFIVSINLQLRKNKNKKIIGRAVNIFVSY